MSSQSQANDNQCIYFHVYGLPSCDVQKYKLGGNQPFEKLFATIALSTGSQPGAPGPMLIFKDAPLDRSKTPFDYGMKPGVDNVVVLHAAYPPLGTPNPQVTSPVLAAPQRGAVAVSNRVCTPVTAAPRGKCGPVPITPPPAHGTFVVRVATPSATAGPARSTTQGVGGKPASGFGASRSIDGAAPKSKFQAIEITPLENYCLNPQVCAARQERAAASQNKQPLVASGPTAAPSRPAGLVSITSVASNVLVQPQVEQPLQPARTATPAPDGPQPQEIIVDRAVPIGDGSGAETQTYTYPLQNEAVPTAQANLNAEIDGPVASPLGTKIYTYPPSDKFRYNPTDGNANQGATQPESQVYDASQPSGSVKLQSHPVFTSTATAEAKNVSNGEEPPQDHIYTYTATAEAQNLTPGDADGKEPAFTYTTTAEAKIVPSEVDQPQFSLQGAPNVQSPTYETEVPSADFAANAQPPASEKNVSQPLSPTVNVPPQMAKIQISTASYIDASDAQMPSSQTRALPTDYADASNVQIPLSQKRASTAEYVDASNAQPRTYHTRSSKPITRNYVNNQAPQPTYNYAANVQPPTYEAEVPQPTYDSAANVQPPTYEAQAPQPTYNYAANVQPPTYQTRASKPSYSYTANVQPTSNQRSAPQQDDFELGHQYGSASAPNVFAMNRNTQMSTIGVSGQPAPQGNFTYYSGVPRVVSTDPSIAQQYRPKTDSVESIASDDSAALRAMADLGGYHSKKHRPAPSSRKERYEDVLQLQGRQELTCDATRESLQQNYVTLCGNMEELEKKVADQEVDLLHQRLVGENLAMREADMRRTLEDEEASMENQWRQRESELLAKVDTREVMLEHSIHDREIELTTKADMQESEMKQRVSDREAELELEKQELENQRRRQEGQRLLAIKIAAQRAKEKRDAAKKAAKAAKKKEGKAKLAASGNVRPPSVPVSANRGISASGQPPSMGVSVNRDMAVSGQFPSMGHSANCPPGVPNQRYAALPTDLRDLDALYPASGPSLSASRGAALSSKKREISTSPDEESVDSSEERRRSKKSKHDKDKKKSKHHRKVESSDEAEESETSEYEKPKQRQVKEEKSRRRDVKQEKSKSRSIESDEKPANQSEEGEENASDFDEDFNKSAPVAAKSAPVSAAKKSKGPAESIENMTASSEMIDDSPTSSTKKDGDGDVDQVVVDDSLASNLVQDSVDVPDGKPIGERADATEEGVSGQQKSRVPAGMNITPPVSSSNRRRISRTNNPLPPSRSSMQAKSRESALSDPVAAAAVTSLIFEHDVSAARHKERTLNTAAGHAPGGPVVAPPASSNPMLPEVIEAARAEAEAHEKDLILHRVRELEVRAAEAHRRSKQAEPGYNLMNRAITPHALKGEFVTPNLRAPSASSSVNVPKNSGYNELLKAQQQIGGAPQVNYGANLGGSQVGVSAGW